MGHQNDQGNYINFWTDPLPAGKKLRCALKTLEREYKKENDKLFLEFTKKLDELLAPHEISRKYGHR